MKYDLIVCGGTFDLLHKGHKSFLEQAFKLSQKVVVGITSDSYVSKFKDQNFENFETRKKFLLKFLKEIKVFDRVEIQEIDDSYGPLLDKNLNVDAIAVTLQTRKTAEEINKTRRERGLTELAVEILEMDLADDSDFISSTRIRKGEINRNGRLYVKKNWENIIFILPQDLRHKLHKPFGKLLKKLPEKIVNEKTMTIGDVTSYDFNKNNFKQLISIIDFKVQRNIKFSNVVELGFSDEINKINIENKPATINSKLFDNIKNSIESTSQVLIIINGEEDLAFLPAVLVSPLGFTVYYGQPNEGLVEVKVTEENKEKIFELINKFGIKNFDK